MKKYSISVIELALPSPRSGSIDTYSGFGPMSKRAIKAHQYYQQKQLKEETNYIAETTVFHTIDFKSLQFTITGRIDGVYQDTQTRIEEIKTAFDPNKLMQELDESHLTHPYWLQLQLYGYIHWLKTNTIPQLNLLVISLRNNKKTYPLSMTLDIDNFECWLHRRLDELVFEVKQSKQRMERRKKLSEKLIFPFPTPRPQQEELINFVSSTMNTGKPMLIQAPTGLGKTLGVLYPALKESLGRGQKTIYITPKNTQHQLALDAVRLLQLKGASCKTLVLTAKKKLCMKNEPICTSKHCEFAENHYTKCTDNKLVQEAAKKRNLGESYFKKIAKQYQVCPYDLQMACIPQVDVVIGDYNYVFSSTNTNTRVVHSPLGEQDKPNLVIDEVHNLPSRSRDYFSPELNIKWLESYLHIQTKYPATFEKKLTQRITESLNLIKECATPGNNQIHKVTIPELQFKKQEELFNQLLTDYLEADTVITENDPIIRLCNYWSDFTSALEFVNQNTDEFFISYHPQLMLLKITCLDASQLIKENYKHFRQIIGFSATLKPFDYYSQLMGLNTDNLQTQEFSTPFPPENRKLLAIPQVSTKYRDRARNYAKIIEVILRVSSIRPGNYFIFFPSFEFLEQVYNLMPDSHPFTLIRQERTMSPFRANQLLRKLHEKDKPHLFFAVQGGMFSEGIDYVGELAIGAFIVGPPLPIFNWENEQLKAHYEQKYRAGNEYTYVYPAMTKAIQAAGRVIRTEADRGLIILMDNRFLNTTFSQCMPKDWFEEHPQEMVSSAILKDIELFWNEKAIEAET